MKQILTKITNGEVLTREQTCQNLTVCNFCEY